MKLTNTIRMKILEKYVSLKISPIQTAREELNQEITRLYSEQHVDEEKWFKEVPQKFKHFILRKNSCYLTLSDGRSFNDCVALSVYDDSENTLYKVLKTLELTRKLCISYSEIIGDNKVFNQDDKVVIPPASQGKIKEYKKLINDLSEQVAELEKVLKSCNTTNQLFELLPELKTETYLKAVGDVKNMTALVPLNLVQKVRKDLSTFEEIK